MIDKWNSRDTNVLILSIPYFFLQADSFWIPIELSFYGLV